MERAVAAVSLTVMLRVVLHGVTAGPLGRRYVPLSHADAEAEAETADIRSRRLAHEQATQVSSCQGQGDAPVQLPERAASFVGVDSIGASHALGDVGWRPPRRA